MKSTVKSSHEHMWKAVQKEIADLSTEKHSTIMPEIHLLSAVMVQAGIDHADDYFESQKFITHCNLLRLHSKFVLSLFKRCWRIEKTGVIWEYTSPLLEDDDAA